MKVLIEYAHPEESSDIDMALHGHKWKIALEDFDNWLRNLLKHTEMSDESDAAYSTCREKLTELLHEYNLNLFE